jgi:hypothetical protein
MKHLPYLLFPFGIVIGYLIPKQSSSLATIVEKTPPAREERTKAMSSTSEKSSRIKLLADSAMKNTCNSSLLATAEISDIPAILDRILCQVGPSGLSSQTRYAIDAMLARWAKDDFDTAFHWAKTHPNENARKDFLEGVLKNRAETDFEGTLALLKSLQSEDGITLELGSEMLDAGLKLGARQAFEALSLCPSDSHQSSGSSSEFPQDFDFQTFAELAAQHTKNIKTYHPFSYFPSNVYEAWAKNDLNAAFDFYLTHGELQFNDLGSITKTFLNTAEPASTYPWLLQQYESLNAEQRAKFAGDLDDVFPYQFGVTPLVKFANSISSPELKENMVNDMIKGFGTTQREPNEYFYIDLLSTLPTPEKRAEVIRNNNLNNTIKSVSDQKLRELGLTREQFKN